MASSAVKNWLVIPGGRTAMRTQVESSPGKVSARRTAMPRSLSAACAPRPNRARTKGAADGTCWMPRPRRPAWSKSRHCASVAARSRASGVAVLLVHAIVAAMAGAVLGASVPHLLPVELVDRVVERSGLRLEPICEALLALRGGSGRCQPDAPEQRRP